MRKIPFFNYPGLFAENSETYLETLSAVLGRGAFIMQKELVEFEENLASYLGCKHAIGVADGTAALEMSLMAAGIGRGDEVIVSSHTFVATAAAVHHVGAVPVVADCLEDSMIDPESVYRMISPKTKAIMPTQLNGRTCDMAALTTIAEKFNLAIVEDSCQALGAKYDDQYAGLFGVAGSYSFYPAKTLGSFGDGGAVVTNDDRVAEYILQLRDHGRDKNGKVSMFGRNGRLDNIQAAILDLKLSNYDSMITRRREIASIYHAELGDIEQLILPPPPTDTGHNFDIYQNYEIQAYKRDMLREYLAENGVGTIIQWGGWMLHQFDDLHLRCDAPYAEKLSKAFMLLPMHHLLTDEDIMYICKQIQNFYS